VDQTIKIWDVATGKEIRTLVGHAGWVHTLSWSRDGRRLASGGWDQTVKFWDSDTGNEVASFRAHVNHVNAVSWSPDSRRLASASSDQTIKIWDGTVLTTEARVEREAVALLNYVFSRPLPRADILEHLSSSPTLQPQVRAAAVDLIGRFHEETDAKRYYDAAWPVVRNRYANIFTSQLALAQMKKASAQAPTVAPYRIGLGVAQYRLGKFEKERYAEAQATLTTCDPNHPAALAFLALAQHQLGEKEQARATLARLRELMKRPEWAAHAESRADLHEAAALIDGEPTQPKP
jgi:hypothetical protein